MSKEKKKSTLVEQHALKRLEKVEENQRKEYEKKIDYFPLKQIIMGLLFGVMLLLMLIQMIVK
ncbi:hypothetical protein CBF51_01100 [Lactobacillus taiwanensis]|nr:hypothetical protein CBF51_01100 [Lactobacillus taiwanensis]